MIVATMVYVIKLLTLVFATLDMVKKTVVLFVLISVVYMESVILKL